MMRSCTLLAEKFGGKAALGFVDFRTLAARKHFCEEEVRLNRRTAPTLYRGVVAVTRERDGSLALGGAGSPVDWVVEMRRFDQETLFDRLVPIDIAHHPHRQGVNDVARHLRTMS